jgi:hypothetical protein
MKSFSTDIKPLSGTNYSEIHPKAWALYKQIASKTKRRPYVRSAYFKKDKIFLNYFWDHIWQKNLRDRTRRLIYYPCGLDLIQNSRIEPESKINANRKSEVLHRFIGMAPDKKLFSVQIKEDRKSGQKHFISVFPYE